MAKSKTVLALSLDALNLALAYAASNARYEAHSLFTEVLSQARREGLLRLFLNFGEALTQLLRQSLSRLRDDGLRSYAQSILRARAQTSGQGKASPRFFF